MAIFRHPDGTYHRYRPDESQPAKKAVDDYENPDHWKQMPGAQPGIQIHRDGKTMRNTAPPPPAKWYPSIWDQRLNR